MGNTALSSRRDSASSSTGGLPYKATGLYATTEWDEKIVRKLVLERKVAPRYPGREELLEPDLEECPICFLYYPGGLNRSKCCRKPICTECFLQVKPPRKSKDPPKCPFCLAPRYAICFTGPMTEAEKQAEEREEQDVLALQMKMREEEIAQDRAREAERLAKMEKEAMEKARNEASGGPAGSTTESSGPSTVEVRASATPSTHDPVQDETSEQERAQQFHADLAEMGNSPASAAAILAATQIEHGESARSGQGAAELGLDLEEIMIMEAIRQSLLESGGAEGEIPSSDPLVEEAQEQEQASMQVEEGAETATNNLEQASVAQNTQPAAASDNGELSKSARDSTNVEGDLIDLGGSPISSPHPPGPSLDASVGLLSLDGVDIDIGGPPDSSHTTPSGPAAVDSESNIPADAADAGGEPRAVLASAIPSGPLDCPPEELASESKPHAIPSGAIEIVKSDNVAAGSVEHHGSFSASEKSPPSWYKEKEPAPSGNPSANASATPPNQGGLFL